MYSDCNRVWISKADCKSGSLDGLVVVWACRVVLDSRDDGDGKGQDDPDVDLRRQAPAVVAVVVPPHLLRVVQHVVVLHPRVIVLQDLVPAQWWQCAKSSDPHFRGKGIKNFTITVNCDVTRTGSKSQGHCSSKLLLVLHMHTHAEAICLNFSSAVAFSSGSLNLSGCHFPASFR